MQKKGKRQENKRRNCVSLTLLVNSKSYINNRSIKNIPVLSVIKSMSFRCVAIHITTQLTVNPGKMTENEDKYKILLYGRIYWIVSSVSSKIYSPTQDRVGMRKPSTKSLRTIKKM